MRNIKIKLKVEQNIRFIKFVNVYTFFNGAHTNEAVSTGHAYEEVNRDTTFFTAKVESMVNENRLKNPPPSSDYDDPPSKGEEPPPVREEPPPPPPPPPSLTCIGSWAKHLFCNRDCKKMGYMKGQRKWKLLKGPVCCCM
ncbi:hypothetical protein QJS04_geneDACA017857 [Acorus gramineus]|uniref:Uncharacterized protein n=1 Tax=Acorus gramineus TaxID=55184 RepID=A0AAV9AKM1_ACOGR|nr:hypothetical protein QJS04_geneDACA017857 [Acorus gramineus]